MDPVKNPFAPSAGRRPPEIAGRDSIIDVATTAVKRALLNKHARPIMLLGLRGTGKTVLLNEFQKVAEQSGALVSKIEAPEGASLSRLIVPEMRKVLRSLSGVEAAKHMAVRGLRGLQNFASRLKVEVGGIGIGIEGASEPEPGLADSGDIQFDLPDLFETLGMAARSARKAWLLLIDEVQYLSAEDLSALIVSLHRVSQSELPIAFAGAGLPQVARLAGEARSYAERLFVYPPVDALDRDSAAIALSRPIEKEGAQIAPDALEAMVDTTRGYPFFLQEWGSAVWEAAPGPLIVLQDVNRTHEQVVTSLDNGFFKVRLDRLTRTETEFVAAMATLGDGPYPLAEIAKVLNRKPSSLGPARASIISKGMIYSAEHGYLAFTVPLFADFMRRQNRNRKQP
ncbi:MAG: ATP-binding protein [Rhodobacter sp.]|nr:ATP-binding protein [Rhodobacter sp.]MCA3513679.1 ATP-binding protein [Rhodobacter sp.]MCA3520450.1 ATP-binding protein [Rhodobacter sp.]MCA3526058.1 ATP-binding protein [Rhodobacter sp.]MCA3529714.1 ATP-binding protein [Rhodobacter sp.]